MPHVYEQVGLARDSQTLPQKLPHSSVRQQQALTLLSQVWMWQHFVSTWGEKSFYWRAWAKNNCVTGERDLNVLVWCSQSSFLQYLYFHICKHNSSPGEGNGNPLQHSCLGNSTDRGAWQATVCGVTKQLDMTEWLKNNKKSQQIQRLIRPARHLWCISSHQSTAQRSESARTASRSQF